jgi:hypothetical protein
MKTFDFVQVTISFHLKDPHSKSLEPDWLSPFTYDYEKVFRGEGWMKGPPDPPELFHSFRGGRGRPKFPGHIIKTQFQ